MFGALKRGFQSTASLILVRNVVDVLQPKRILAASRGFLSAARLSCYNYFSSRFGFSKLKGIILVHIFVLAQDCT